MSSLASELYNRSTYSGNGNGQKSDVKISLISFCIFFIMESAKQNLRLFFL